MTPILARSKHPAHGCHARSCGHSESPCKSLSGPAMGSNCINDGLSYSEVDKQESSHEERKSFGEIS